MGRWGYYITRVILSPRSIQGHLPIHLGYFYDVKQMNEPYETNTSTNKLFNLRILFEFDKIESLSFFSQINKRI